MKPFSKHTLSGIALTVSVFKIVSGKRLAFRPIAGATDEIPVGIARATNGDVTPAGEKFCEILRKISKGDLGSVIACLLAPLKAR